MQDRIKQVEENGIEKIYNYPYNKVFSACENMPIQMGFLIYKSNFNEGYIYLTLPNSGGAGTVGIKIKQIDDNKTLLKIYKFHTAIKKTFYKDFFYRLDDLLNREQ